MLRVSLLSVTVIAVFLTALAGCGLFFGGEQSVDNKSHDYTVVRLDRDSPPQWRRIDAETLAKGAPDKPLGKGYEPGPSAQETGDIAFEHRETGALISVNSACGPYNDASLEELSKQLLLGLNTTNEVSQREVRVAGTRALESTFDTTMSQRSPSARSKKSLEQLPVRVRAVVLQKEGCTFDLIYIARPAYFKRQLSDFDRFLKGFHAQ